MDSRQRSAKAAKRSTKAPFFLRSSSMSCIALRAISGMRWENSVSGTVPTVVFGLTPFEEEAEDCDEFFCVLDGVVEHDVAVLEEQGAVGALEEDVGAGIARLKLLLHLGFEGIFGVLGFPVAAREIGGVDEGSVNAEGMAVLALDGVLGDEGPVVLAGAGLEQVLEGSADVTLLVEVAAGEALEGGVVGLDRSGGRFEVECAHVRFSEARIAQGVGFSGADLAGGHRVGNERGCAAYFASE